MTIGELREALAKIDSAYDDRNVKVWLPPSSRRLAGPDSRISLLDLISRRSTRPESRISLSDWIYFPSGNEHDFLIEGKVDDGSVILGQGY